MPDAAPIRRADFTVRLFLPCSLLAADDRVNAVVAALDNLDFRRRLAALVRYELETRPVFAGARVAATLHE